LSILLPNTSSSTRSPGDSQKSITSISKYCWSATTYIVTDNLSRYTCWCPGADPWHNQECEDSKVLEESKVMVYPSSKPLPDGQYHFTIDPKPKRVEIYYNHGTIEFLEAQKFTAEELQEDVDWELYNID